MHSRCCLCAVRQRQRQHQHDQQNRPRVQTWTPWDSSPRWRHAGTGCKQHVRDTRSALVGSSDPVQELGELVRKPQNNRRARQSYRRPSESCHRFHRRDGVEMPPISPGDAHHQCPDSRTPVRSGRHCDGDGKARAHCAAVWRLRFGGCGCHRGASAANPASTKRLESFPPPPPSSGFGRESVPIDAQQWYCYAPCFENNKVWGHCRLLLGETT